MPVPVGTKLGTYEVTSHIGSGGMGEVYQAHDSKLGRDVAIKVLPQQFARDPERLARFQREAKMLAALNHPNIAAIYGLEQSGDKHYLVMELVPGQTLAERIRTGAIPVDEALPIARQVAEAVEYAHDKNVIHRDLKPANIKVTAEGTVKVLDFGLAKAMSEELSEMDSSNSPTLSIAATRPGAILGTPAYMSPEQAKGKSVDRRTDVWAIGCVLYEMLTGKQAFEGGDITEVFASLVMKEPNFDALPAGTPPSIQNLLRRCLEKDARGRLQHMGEARIAIERAGAPISQAAMPEESAWPARRSFALAIGGLLAGAIIAGGIAWSLRPSIPPQPARRFNYDLPQGQQFRNSGFRLIDISPDGRRFVFNTTNGLYVREMNQSEAVWIQGKEEVLLEPFFSPDGQSVAYFQNGQLKRIPITGGPPETICPAQDELGATWVRDGTIVLSERDGVWRVPAEGGTPVLIIESKQGETLTHPQMLPGGEWVLMTTKKGSNYATDGDIVLESLRSKERRVLLQGASDARYIAAGYLAYVINNVLFAAAFDLKTMKLSGEKVALIQGVDRAAFNAAGNYAFSDDGSLVYVSGQGIPAKKLVWVNRDGTSATINSIPAGHYDSPRISPDGKRVLVWADRDGWIYEFESGRSTRLTSDGSGDTDGEWDPTGAQVAYSSSKGSTALNAWIQPADGSGEAKKLTDFPGIIHVDGWSHDAKTLAVHFHAPDGGSNLLMLPMTEAKPEAKEFLKGRASEAGTVFSPDGKYVAYYSEETGRGEVYIRPYPGPGGRSIVSVGGGREPMWAASSELFYRNIAGDRMIGVTVKTQPTLTIGAPHDVFQGRYYLSPSRRPQYDVTANGQRFLMLEAGTTDTSAMRPSVNIVLNWFEELKQKVPTGTK